MGKKQDKNDVKNALGNSDDSGNKAKKAKKKLVVKGPKLKLPSIFNNLQDPRFVKISGLFVLLASAYLFIAFISYFISWFSWNSDDNFSNITIWRVLFDQEIVVHNITGRIGAALSQVFIKNWFGIASFLFLYISILFGLRLAFNFKRVSIKKALKHSFFILIWLSLSLGFFFQGQKASVFGGVLGFEASQYFKGLIGNPGTIILIVFSLISFLVFGFDILKYFNSKTENEAEAIAQSMDKYEVDGLNIDELAALVNQNNPIEEETNNDEIEYDFDLRVDEKVKKKVNETNKDALSLEIETTNEEANSTIFGIDESEEDELNLGIEPPVDETLLSDDEISHSHGIETIYDPTEDLRDFKNPSIDLLREHSTNEITINKEELEENKIKIVNTLANYAIQIDKIKATIGPTVTLYEIVPAPGVRISKIKNLEDDIAMSLAALGIRIIAPIPGRGTIGIEVPNKNPEIVSMRTIIASEKFQNSKFDLPVAIGKTISNETFVFDLAKMPHLLVAGATGQGKSVGLNAIITSLLYKMHPAQLKFVMVDPKKVEFSLFSKIEKHYLAKLPGRTDAIITDNKEVVATINSLCMEMDDRYELLKVARAKNLKEYNVKFINRQLNPENGHRYLPYIVLVIDEFADLIMTAGKEVEMPIARLAQLARAIGIHLIIATQRPSVNVITGLIKANFPARIAFRVTSKIDSRTILDTGGADQLIGRGDMLFSKGDGLVRLQCAFVDTPEVEDIVDYIGEQRGYGSAFNLPEFVGDEDSGKVDVTPEERDVLFEDAARVIVTHQQGSTSLIQRKMKLGYNRAGRIIDQLEAAGIVGPFGGSKARDVLISDLASLEQYLEDMRY